MGTLVSRAHELLLAPGCRRTQMLQDVGSKKRVRQLKCGGRW